MIRTNRFIFACGVAVLLWILWVLAGCAWFRSPTVKSAEELAAEGMGHYEDEDYGDALKTFTTLKERYPYSRYAILAELKVADAHFNREEYPEAIAAYQDFARLHPKNEVIPYVLFQIGVCYYRQLLSADRDQTATHEAILAFERLLMAHPNSTYKDEAKERIRMCRELLAEHEIYVGHFYYKSKQYGAALRRFEGALNDYHDALSADRRQEMEQLILVCKEKMVDGDRPPDSVPEGNIEMAPGPASSE